MGAALVLCTGRGVPRLGRRQPWTSALPGSGADQEPPGSGGVCAGAEVTDERGEGQRGTAGRRPHGHGGGTGVRVLSRIDYGWIGILEGPSGCRVESGLQLIEMGSHTEGKRLGHLQLLAAKTTGLDDRDVWH